MAAKDKLLLHSCCGPCSTSVLERIYDTYSVDVFFYNPNITEEEEYKKRRDTQIEFLEKKYCDKITFFEGNYNPDCFFEIASGYEFEQEGGKRCERCFLLRLEETAKEAKYWGYDFFGTTLTVSPHKNAEKLHEIGFDLEKKYGIAYLKEDFKKKDGYKKSIDISKEYGLYRQNYCGCQYSKR